MNDHIVHVTDDTFDEQVLRSDRPVLVDFWAEWSEPCKMLDPTLIELAGEYSDRLSVAKLNVDDNPSIVARYQIRVVPTLMLFKDGRLAKTKIGAISRSQLTEFLDRNLER